MLYFGQKRYAQSAEATERALKINDQNYLVWQNLVIAYQWLNDKGKTVWAREQAIGSAERAVRDKPQDALAHATLASLYANKGIVDKTLTQIQSALALSPSDPFVLEPIAVAYDGLGQREKAKLYVGKALDAGYPLDKIKNDPELQDLLKDPSFRPHGK
jgi:tetratricopeptide (TPR) repeat protein